VAKGIELTQKSADISRRYLGLGEDSLALRRRQMDLNNITSIINSSVQLAGAVSGIIQDYRQQNTTAKKEEANVNLREQSTKDALAGTNIKLNEATGEIEYTPSDEYLKMRQDYEDKIREAAPFGYGDIAVQQYRNMAGQIELEAFAKAGAEFARAADSLAAQNIAALDDKAVAAGGAEGILAAASSVVGFQDSPKAKMLLEKAERQRVSAEQLFEYGDYDEAQALAQEAQDLAAQAREAGGNVDNPSVKNVFDYIDSLPWSGPRKELAKQQSVQYISTGRLGVAAKEKVAADGLEAGLKVLGDSFIPNVMGGEEGRAALRSEIVQFDQAKTAENVRTGKDKFSRDIYENGKTAQQSVLEIEKMFEGGVIRETDRTAVTAAYRQIQQQTEMAKWLPIHQRNEYSLTGLKSNLDALVKQGISGEFFRDPEGYESVRNMFESSIAHLERTAAGDASKYLDQMNDVLAMYTSETPVPVKDDAGNIVSYAPVDKATAIREIDNIWQQSAAEGHPVSFSDKNKIAGTLDASLRQKNMAGFDAAVDRFQKSEAYTKAKHDQQQMFASNIQSATLILRDMIQRNAPQQEIDDAAVRAMARITYDAGSLYDQETAFGRLVNKDAAEAGGLADGLTDGDIHAAAKYLQSTAARELVAVRDGTPVWESAAAERAAKSVAVAQQREIEHVTGGTVRPGTLMAEGIRHAGQTQQDVAPLWEFRGEDGKRYTAESNGDRWIVKVWDEDKKQWVTDRRQAREELSRSVLDETRQTLSRAVSSGLPAGIANAILSGINPRAELFTLRAGDPELSRNEVMAILQNTGVLRMRDITRSRLMEIIDGYYSDRSSGR
jgi:hypothetical protein